jgi:hypothetical protein
MTILDATVAASSLYFQATSNKNWRVRKLFRALSNRLWKLFRLFGLHPVWMTRG